jgi:hypothetical protein
MTAWGVRSASLSPLPNEIKKTKLQIYTEPQAGINILLPAGHLTQVVNKSKLNR